MGRREYPWLYPVTWCYQKSWPRLNADRAAIIVIDGLSVCCFNKTGDEKFWEVAYPRAQQHQLCITIWELDDADRPVGTDPIIDVEVNAGVGRFNICLTNGSVAHYSQFRTGGPCPTTSSALIPRTTRITSLGLLTWQDPS